MLTSKWQLTICKQHATLNTNQSQHTHIPNSRTLITRFKQNDEHSTPDNARQTYQSTWYTTVTMTTPIYDDAKDYVIQHGYAVNCIDDQQRKGSRRCYDFISTPIVDAGDDHIQDDQHSKKRPALISVIMMEPVSSNNEANQHNITANHYHNQSTPQETITYRDDAKKTRYHMNPCPAGSNPICLTKTRPYRNTELTKCEHRDDTYNRQTYINLTNVTYPKQSIITSTTHSTYTTCHTSTRQQMHPPTPYDCFQQCYDWIQLHNQLQDWHQETATKNRNSTRHNKNAWSRLTHQLHYTST